MDKEKEVKKEILVSENIFLDGEHVLYHNGDIIITEKRVIKHKTGSMAKISEFFSEDYQDMDIRKIVSIKIEERLHMVFIKIGLVILLLAPLILVVSQVDALAPYVGFFSDSSAKIASILLFFSMLFFIFSVAFKVKVLTVFGEGQAKMDFHSYSHKDLLALRKYQFHNSPK